MEVRSNFRSYFFVSKKIQRFWAIHAQMRGDLTFRVDLDPHIDAAEFRRIEADFEAVLAVERLRNDFDRKARDRHGLGEGWLLNGRGLPLHRL